MDQSIGEASSMMGMVMQEMLRRSLRGGVLRIGEQLETYVSETVDTSLAEHKPKIEQLAMGTAARTAEATAEAVTTREIGSLTIRVDETHRKAQSLGGRLDETKLALSSQIETATLAVQEQLADAERRVAAANEEHVRRSIGELSARSRKSGDALRARHAVLERTLTRISQEALELKYLVDALSVRVQELERPRGWAEWWKWITGQSS
jgi:hypothetical protein